MVQLYSYGSILDVIDFCATPTFILLSLYSPSFFTSDPLRPSPFSFLNK